MSDAIQQGELIGERYQVLSRLGSGGMADVYLAQDTKLGRKVAVKVLLARFAGDAQFVERFRREAQAAAQLNHPGIVGIHDWGMFGDTYFIVMEHVQGETLKDRIRREGRFDPGEAVRIELELLAALEVAHAAHIVHRDIKSQNILLDPQGTAKVTDFGIARAGDSQMTEAGSILGTAQYIAPEQAKGQAVDERTDLYAAGVVLYEMLTGTVPFQGDSAVSVALKHVNEYPPEPSELVPELPYSLNQIVLKALAKDPERRYSSAAEFIADLNSARSGGPLLAAAFDPSLERTQVRTPTLSRGEDATRVMSGTSVAVPPRPPESVRKRKRSAWPWVLLALFLVIAAVTGFVLWRSFDGTTVKVPSVVGLSEAAAKGKLEAAGFRVSVHDTYSDDVQTGFVADQKPSAQTKLAEGETVDLWVCRGPEHVALVDFRGWSPDQVEKWLKDNGLVGQEMSGTSGAVAKNRIFKQDPAAGEQVARGDTVTYWVSRGKPQVAVPDLAGTTQAEATQALQAAGLTLGVVTQQSSASVPAGQIVSQDPVAATKVAKGSSVSIVVSIGPSASPTPTATPSASATPVQVPAVVTMDRTTAEAALTAKGFVVVVKKVGSAQPVDTVIGQNPAGGTFAAPGSTVVIRVAK